MPRTVSPYATSTFVVKVASRCNLACSYCYMYRHADQSWRTRPRFMSRQTVRQLAGRLEEHARESGVETLVVVAHGGEPLLYPDLDFFLGEIRGSVSSAAVEFAVQTNGTLLNPGNLTVLERHGVQIGVSVDGSRESHDRLRVTHAGKGTFDRVMQGLRLARARVPHLLGGVLQVIDLSVPPVQALDTLESFGVPFADLLLPDLNHDTLPASGIRPGEVGAWLTELFDAWAAREKTLDLRVFSTITRLLLGSPLGTDHLGASSGGVLVVETDGSYEVHDALKTTVAGAGYTGMCVERFAIAAVEAFPLVLAFRDKASGAAPQCLRCGLFTVCGGGSPLHRYSNARGFRQPSVYCADLALLIEHVARYLLRMEPGLRLAVDLDAGPAAAPLASVSGYRPSAAG